MEKTIGPNMLLNKPNLKLTISMYILTFIWATTITMFGPLIPVFIDQYGISIEQGGLITLFQGTGGVLAVILGIFIAGKIKKSLIIKLTWFAFCISLLFLSFINSYAAVVILFFVIGSSTKMIEAMLNAIVADINNVKRGFYLNLLHASLGMGALAGPLFSSIFIELKASVQFLFLFFCILAFLGYFQYVVIFRNTNKQIKQETEQEITNYFIFLKNGTLLLSCIVSFLYIGYSIAVATWMPAFMLQILHTDVMLSGIPVSLFFIGVIIGRFIYPLFQEKWDMKSFMIVSNIIGACFFIFSLLAQNILLLFVAVTLFGLVSASLVPNAVSIACTLFPKNKGSVSSLVFLFIAAGQMVIPWLLGYVSKIDFTLSIISIGILALITAFILIFIPSEKKIELA